MGYSFWFAATVLLYASSNIQDNTYHGLCYTTRGELAGTRNSSMCPPCGIDPTTHVAMSECSYHGSTSRSWDQSYTLIAGNRTDLVLTLPCVRVGDVRQDRNFAVLAGLGTLDPTDDVRRKSGRGVGRSWGRGTDGITDGITVTSSLANSDLKTYTCGWKPHCMALILLV